MYENYDIDGAEEKRKDVFEVESEEILKEYSDADIEHFVRDLFLVFDVMTNIDKEYSEADSNRINKDVKHFKSMIIDWNRKYRDILLEFVKDGVQCRLKVNLLERTLSEIMPLLKRMNRFKGVKLSAGKLEASYDTIDMNGENSLTLVEDGGTLKMLFYKEDMLDPKSPEFKLCTFYALKGGYDTTINLQKYKQDFSFSSYTEEQVEAQSGWQSTFSEIKFIRN